MHNHPVLPPATSTKWLGATPDASKTGTDFVFYAGKDATNVELCLFDKAEGAHETQHFNLAAKEMVLDNGTTLAADKDTLEFRLHKLADYIDSRDFDDAGRIHVCDAVNRVLIMDVQHSQMRHRLQDWKKGIEQKYADAPDKFEAFLKDMQGDIGGLTDKNPLKNYQGLNIVGYIWHGHAEGVGEGRLYGFRVDGPREKGYNPNKLLVDPAAKALTHDFTWNAKMHGGHDENDGPVKPKARVVDWQGLAHKAAKRGILYPHADTIICEGHVKGSTFLHSDISEEHRGKYKGLADPAFIGWLKGQQINALELMPMAAHGAGDYWGYGPFAPSAPHTGYAATERPECEFMEDVRTLKENGIETILDVVPNHTLEGNDRGPTLNLRGMDPTLYAPEDATGCGNTRDFAHPINQRLFLEELKYWRQMGIAGFRIDLASVIGREHSQSYNPYSPMVKAIHEDPELADVKFYGEPWDIKGYFLGALARIDDSGQNNISEWEGKARDIFAEAAFDAKHDVPRHKLITHMAGSEEDYAFHGAGPEMSVNYVMSHDGPTWLDAVSSPDGKKNEPNGHNNSDGNDIPKSWYWGNEEDRWRVQRFAAAILALSQSEPMVTLGHERGHTQDSNTNPYNQDTDITKIKWNGVLREEGKRLMDFNAAANRLRKRHASLRRATYLTGKTDEASAFTWHGEKLKDVTWLEPDGTELTKEAMQRPGGFGILLSGDPGNSPDKERSPVRLIRDRPHEEPLLALINPTREDITFTLPDVPGLKWSPVLNSLGYDSDGSPREGSQQVNIGWRSVMVFKAQRLQEISHGR